MSHTYSLIRQAILHKHHVLATYDGHRRELCPHALGHTKGEERCLFYQVAGGSSRGRARGWRCMAIDKLSWVSVRPGPWHSDDTGHSRSHHCVENVDLDVMWIE